MSSYGLSQTIRLTVGLPAENERFLAALKKVLGL
jgi:histidinol-phosphate/aromatic aminotransferase/cobyric acid decarboxylase-like protein